MLTASKSIKQKVSNKTNNCQHTLHRLKFTATSRVSLQQRGILVIKLCSVFTCTTAFVSLNMHITQTFYITLENVVQINDLWHNKNTKFRT